MNPLHIDPLAAKDAGFDRPILHGLCTLGVAGHALLRTLCSYDPSSMKRLDARFTAPVYLGETIRTELWHLSLGEAIFSYGVVERNLAVLNRDRFSRRPSSHLMINHCNSSSIVLKLGLSELGETDADAVLVVCAR
jgi:hypothetical protein